MSKSFQRIALAAAIASASLVPQAIADERFPIPSEDFQIADSSLSQAQILKRLEDLERSNKKLERKVQSLQKQLQNSSGTYTATSSPSEDKNKGAYITAGIGALNVADVTAEKGDGDFSPTSIDSSLSNEIGLGYRFNKNLRGEFTYGVNVAKKDKNVSGDWDPNWFETSSIFVSAYYDFDLDGKYKPYLGAGLGTTTIHTDESDDGEAFTFGYQGK